jgi:tripartite-type tricarboxylate transporter receptor subunit TctC
VPTLDEAGVRGYESELWFGLLTARGTPRPILDKLNAGIRAALSDAETRAKWAPIGIEPSPTSPEEFDRLVQRDTALFTKIARAAGIKAE